MFAPPIELPQAQEPVGDDDAESEASPPLNVAVTASFPQSEIFGVKIVNGLATEAVVTFDNNEAGPVAVQLMGGALWSPDFGDTQPSRILRNLSTMAYKSEIPPGGQEAVSYKFTTELHPADLVLKLAAILTDSQGAYYTVPAFEGNVSVVEKPTSIFDPQMLVVLCKICIGRKVFADLTL